MTGRGAAPPGAPLLCSEADVIRTLRAGTYTLAQLYRLCETGADINRADGLSFVDAKRHGDDRVWKRRVRGALQQLRVAGRAHRIGLGVWVVDGPIRQPRRMLLVLNGTALDFELRAVDAIELLSSLDAPCDLLVTDPPYGLNVGDDGGRIEHAYGRDSSLVVPGYVDVPDRDYLEFTCEWIDAAATALRPGAQVAVITGPQRSAAIHLAGERAGLTWISAIAAKQAFPMYTTRRPAFAHWTITILARGGLYDPRRTFHAPSDLPLSQNGNPSPLDLWLDNGRADRPGQLRNGNELPITLLRRIVQMLSNVGDHVVDPFAGAANLGRVCFELRRRFTASDINPRAVRLGGARMLTEAVRPYALAA